MWKIGCSSQGWDQTALHCDEEAVMQELKAQGFDLLEVTAGCLLRRKPTLPVYAVHADKALLDQKPYYISAYIHALRKAMEPTGCRLIVVHPPSAPISNYSFLQSPCHGITVGVENTSAEVFSTVEAISAYTACGVVLDLAHAVRLGVPFTDYVSYRLVHTHIRGVGHSRGYTRLAEGDPKPVLRALDVLRQDQYEGAFLLEYPYRDVQDAVADRTFLSQCLQQISCR